MDNHNKLPKKYEFLIGKHKDTYNPTNSFTTHFEKFSLRFDFFDKPPDDIKNYNFEYLINSSDFGEKIKDSDEESDELMTAQVMSVCDELRNKFSEKTISTEDLDDKFKGYLEAASGGVAFIVNQILDLKNSLFDHMEKFIWIHLYLALLYEPRAIKYITNMNYYNSGILLMKNRKDMNCIDMMGKYNINIEPFKKEILDLKTDKKNKFCVPYICMNTQLFDIFNDGSKEFKRSLRKRYTIGSSDITCFLVACRYNPEVAHKILNMKIFNDNDTADNSSYYSTEERYLSVKWDNFNCLMIAIIHSPSVLKILIRHPKLTSDIFRHCHGSYGCIFTFSCKYDRSFLQDIVKHPYFYLDSYTFIMSHNGFRMKPLDLCYDDLEATKYLLSCPGFLNKSPLSDYYIKNIMFHNEDIFVHIIAKYHIDNQHLESCLDNIIHHKPHLLDCGILNKIPLKFDNFVELIHEYQSASKEIKQIIADKIYWLYTDTYVNKDIIKNSNGIIAVAFFMKEIFSKLVSEKIINYKQIGTVIDILDDATITYLVDRIDIKHLIIPLAKSKPKLLPQVLYSLTKEAFVQKDKNGDNILGLLLNKPSYENYCAVKMIKDHPLFDGQLLKETNKHGITPANKLAYCGYKYVVQFIDINDTMDPFTFIEACRGEDIKLLSSIINNDKFDKSMLDAELMGKSGLSHVDNEEIVEMILNSDHCKLEHVLKALENWIMKPPKLKSINALLECDKFMVPDIYNVSGPTGNILFFLDTCTIEQLIFNKIVPHEALHVENFKGQTIMNYKSFETNKEFLLTIFKNNFICKLDYLKHFDELWKDCDNEFAKVLMNSEYFDEDFIMRKLVFLIDNNKELEAIIEHPNFPKSIDIVEIEDGSHSSILHRLSTINKGALARLLEKNIPTMQLLEHLDINGNTFLHLNIDSIKYYSKSEYRSCKMISAPNGSGISVFLKILMSNTQHLDLLIKSRLIDNTSFLGFKNNELFHSPLVYLCGCRQTDQLNTLIRAGLITEEVLNNPDNNPFTIAITKNNVPALKLLVQIDFNPKLDLIRTVQSLCQTTVLKTIIKSSKMLNRKPGDILDENGHNELIYVISEGNIELASNFLNKDNVNHQDIDGDFILAFAVPFPKMINMIIKKDFFNEKALMSTNNIGMNCSHYLIENFESFQALFESKLFAKDVLHDLLSHQDVYGQTCIHRAFHLIKDNKLKNKLITYITSLDICDEEILLKRDRKGMNILALAITNEEHNIANQCYSKIKKTKSLFTSCDIIGCTMLHYAATNNHNILKRMLKSKHVTEDVLNIRTSNGNTCYMLAAESNSQSLEALLMKDSKSSYLYDHLDTGSCFTIAARHNSQSLQVLLNSATVDMKLLMSTEKGLNILQIACMCNPSSVKIIIEAGVNETLFNKLFHAQPFCFHLAAKYQPDGFEIILNSRYMKEEYLTQTINSKIGVMEAAMYQPKSLRYIHNSKFRSVIDNDNNRIPTQHSSNRITSVYCYGTDTNSFSSAMKSRLVGVENKMCIDMDDNASCMLCAEFKVNTLLSPCNHMVCSACSIKISACPFCKKNISSRNVSFAET